MAEWDWLRSVLTAGVVSAGVSAAIGYFRDRAAARKASIERIDDQVDDLRLLGSRFWGTPGSDVEARPILFEMNAKLQRLSDRLRRSSFQHDRERVKVAFIQLKQELTGGEAESATRAACTLDHAKIEAIDRRGRELTEAIRAKSSGKHVSKLRADR